jgi:tetratricopeptide (TPR) repeat protein
MRLLHFNPSGRLVLTDFRQKTVPLYAILSHRWESGEILFEDLGSEAYKQKDGYRKLEFCANRAAQDGLQYFWIDTCCIDKWNLKELSSAINSMFRWYRNATRCYVYLSDVSASTATEASQQSHWEASFRASKWFTRGWTLQELIAPVLVEFFSCEGQWIGNKTTLEQLINEVTSIPLVALRNCSLDHFTTSERMGWARSRVTTEAEDGAYCLFGILGVSMPPSYGEGKAKAFKRLQDELEADSRAPSIIPFYRNDLFIGRESELAELEEKLFRDEQTTTLTIRGAAGTGKSELALELAYRMRQKDRGCSVFWIDASNKESLQRSYASIAQKIDIPGCDNEQADIFQLLKTHFEERNKNQSLLIYDNIEDRDRGSSNLSTTQEADTIDYLSPSELCSIILTTTNEDTAERFTSQHVVHLEGLTPDMAQAMLGNYVNVAVSQSEGIEAKLLLRELSYLPLAIVQAAAYINTGQMTLREYRSQLDGQLGSALKQDRDVCTNDPVTTTLLVSLDHIRQNNTLAAEYLFFATCVDRKDIPLEFLEAPSYWQKEEALRVLNSHALIFRRPGDSSFDLHRLAHDALREWLQKQGLRDQWSQRAIRRLLSVFPTHENSNRSRWRRFLPHVMRALSCDPTEREDGEKLALAQKCAMALNSDGRYREAEILFMHATETSKRLHGEEHPDTLVTMTNLASVYTSQGRWNEAKELQLQILQLSQRVLGDTHAATLTSMAHLALIHANQGQLVEAERLEVHVREARTSLLGKEHPDTLTSIGNSASLYRSQGRWKEAETVEKEVVEIRKLTLGDEHTDTLTSMDNLASTYWHQRQWEDAEKLQEHVLETRRAVLGDKHRNTMTSMANLASTYYHQGQWDKAESMFILVKDTCTQVLGERHPDTLTSAANLASTYFGQRKWDKAEEMLLQVKETSGKVHGDGHPATLMNLSNLAIAIKFQDRKEEAILLMETCLELREQALGSHHPFTEESRKLLGEWRTEDL